MEPHMKGSAMKNLNHPLMLQIGRLHTTELGAQRIRRNLCLAEEEDVVLWCAEKICQTDREIARKGKNWYIEAANCIITVNAYSYTIITAHRKKPLDTSKL